MDLFDSTQKKLSKVLTEYNSLCNDIGSLVFVGGISGAGRSTALRLIGDMGYYAVDNIPVALFPDFLRTEFESGLKYKHLALILDASSEDKVQDLVRLLDQMRDYRLPVGSIFLECDSPKLLQRYSETRRPHPVFDPSIDNDLSATIEREKKILLPLQERSSTIINTTLLSVQDLRTAIQNFIHTLKEYPSADIFINLCSFGFKFGAPTHCQVIMDVRFLTNPYFENTLRELTGLDKAVSEFVFANPEAIEVESHLLTLIHFLTPKYIREGKPHISVGIGCTGGKHRSVSLVESIARKVSLPGCVVSTWHRDISR